MQALREKICEAATRLFMQLGLRRVSIDDVCNEVRVSKKTFYQYFQKKDDLIVAVIEAEHEKKGIAVGKFIAGKNAIEQLIALSKDIRKNWDSKPELFVNDLNKYYPNIHKEFHRKHEKSAIQFIRDNVKQGIDENFYREDLDIDLVSIFYVHQLQNSFEAVHKFDKKKYTKKKLLDFFLDMYFRVVVNERGMAYCQENYQKEAND